MVDSFALLIILAGIVVFLTLLLLFSLRRNYTLNRELHNFKAQFESESKRRIGMSKSVLLGQVAEHFAPFMPEFPWNPKDARFLGSPVDYVVFDGLTGARGDEGGLNKVIFVEIKTAGSQLTNNERAIREAIKAGRVEFEIIRIGSTK